MINKVYYGPSLLFENGENYWITGTTIEPNQELLITLYVFASSTTSVRTKFHVNSDNNSIFKFIPDPKWIAIKGYESIFLEQTNLKTVVFNAPYISTNENIVDKQVNAIFSGCTNLESIEFKNIKTYNLGNMSQMFSGCSSLQSLNLESFNTEKVTTMSTMFKECSSLQSLNLESFNTEKVTTMASMFYKCSSLQSLNLENFNTDNVTTMSSMFYGCNNLSYIRCKQAFKDWCIENQTTIKLPNTMCEGGTGVWDIVD